MDIQDYYILSRIIEYMAEGVMVLGLNGRIKYINHAAEEILNKNGEELKEVPFVTAFFESDINDEFNQAVLDAIYAPDETHNKLVPFDTGKGMRLLRLVTSLLHKDGEKLGIIIVFGDVTDVADMRMRYASQIEEMLGSLVKALVTAVDARSHYNASHTKNMVRIGNAFLEWMEENNLPQKLDRREKNEFIMSLWLHDVGKLAVPLSIMDKATRLGDAISTVEDRILKVKLLQKIDMLEGKISEDEYQDRISHIDKLNEFVHRVNEGGLRNEEDEEIFSHISNQTYVDENGETRRLFTDKEVECLSVQKGTLTDSEREQMQSHVVVTEKILEQVKFPETYQNVKDWAASHHEFLNGTGYPRGLKGDEICYEVRLLTVIDIFESLTAKDRPYKTPISAETALSIMQKMVDAGEIDGDILELFVKSRVWENLNIK